MGVVLYELCALKPPFDAPSLHLLSMKIIRGVFNPLPSNYSSGMKSLVSNCLSVTASRRPTVNQILKLPLI
jgi:serine/threonine protein kinase